MDLRPRPVGETGGADTGGAGTGGGDATGGAGATGGLPTGGSFTGGSFTGGRSATGAAPSGGMATGGLATGGFPTGGFFTGGKATGGSFTGGMPGTGGVPTGGVSTGGTRTGGAGTGGLPTGGVGAGGVPTGGTGTGGAVATCVWGQSVRCACVDGRVGAQVCQQNGMYAPCVCSESPYTILAQGMVGSWLGTRSSPWTPTEKVAVTFEAGGHYQAVCAQSACKAPVFYYGVDDDVPSKRYALRDVLGDGSGRGEIVIAFGSRMDSVQTGALDAVSLSPDKQHLTFRFWPTWLAMIGPVTFDLTRGM